MCHFRSSQILLVPGATVQTSFAWAPADITQVPPDLPCLLFEDALLLQRCRIIQESTMHPSKCKWKCWVDIWQGKHLSHERWELADPVLFLLFPDVPYDYGFLRDSSIRSSNQSDVVASNMIRYPHIGSPRLILLFPKSYSLVVPHNKIIAQSPLAQVLLSGGM